MRRLRTWWIVVLVGVALENYRRRRAEREERDVVEHTDHNHLLDRLHRLRVP
jgi:hypothetical protein